MEMNVDDVKEPDHSVELTLAWLWVAFGAGMLVVGICLTTFAIGDGLFDAHFMGPVGFMLVCLGTWLVASGGLVIAKNRSAERRANPAIVSLLLLPCICFCQVIAGQEVCMPAAPSSVRHDWEPIPNIEVEYPAFVATKRPDRSIELGTHSAESAGNIQGAKQGSMGPQVLPTTQKKKVSPGSFDDEEWNALFKSTLPTQDGGELGSTRRAYCGAPRVMGYGTANRHSSQR